MRIGRFAEIKELTLPVESSLAGQCNVKDCLDIWPQTLLHSAQLCERTTPDLVQLQEG